MFYWVFCRRVVTKVCHFEGIKSTAEVASGRQPRPCSRPSRRSTDAPQRSTISDRRWMAARRLGFWSGSKRQGISWQGFWTSGEIVAWLPNAWRDRGTPSPSYPLVFQEDHFPSPFSPIKGYTFSKEMTWSIRFLPWKACVLLSSWEPLVWGQDLIGAWGSWVWGPWSVRLLLSLSTSSLIPSTIYFLPFPLHFYSNHQFLHLANILLQSPHPLASFTLPNIPHLHPFFLL